MKLKTMSVQEFKEWAERSGAGNGGRGRSDLWRRTVSNVLAPYVRAIQGEGYSFDAEKFGHSDEERRIIKRATSVEKCDSGSDRVRQLTAALTLLFGRPLVHRCQKPMWTKAENRRRVP